MSDLSFSLPTLQCGSSYTICQDENDNLWSFGDNDYGKCGYKDKITSPKKIDNLTNIKSFSCGSNHTICCDYNGRVFGFGYNTFGQLGFSKEKLVKSQIIHELTDIPKIQQVTCGYYFSICLSIDGELFSFGDNQRGQLGIGHTNNSFKPVIIPNLSNIDYIISGGSCCFCKSITNEYYSWGYNNSGQLAQGDANHIVLIPNICTIPNNIISIKVGSSFVLFLTSNGIVYSCGDNSCGQLGIGNYINSSILKEITSLPFITKISCGYSHSLCVDIDNHLWVFGENKVDQLGLGFTNKREINTPRKHQSLNNVLDLSYNANTTFIKTLDNKILAFGCNYNENIGRRTRNPTVIKPIRILIDNEDIWKTRIPNNRAKSARK